MNKSENLKSDENNISSEGKQDLLQESDEADEIIVKRPTKTKYIDSNDKSDDESEEENFTHFMTDVSYTNLLSTESFNQQNLKEPCILNAVRLN